MNIVKIKSGTSVSVLESSAKNHLYEVLYNDVKYKEHQFGCDYTLTSTSTQVKFSFYYI